MDGAEQAPAFGEHARRGLIVAELPFEAVEFRERDAGLEVRLRVRQRLQFLVGRQQPVRRVAHMASAAVVEPLLGKPARAMQVEVRGEGADGEAVEGLGEADVDVAVAELPAHHGRVLALDQAVVVAVPRARAGEVDVESLQQAADAAVDEFRAVVGVEAEDRERAVLDRDFQRRAHETHAQIRHAQYQFPLRDLVDEVEEIQARSPQGAVAVEAVALMHGVDPQMPGPTVRLGPAPRADGARRRLRPGHPQPPAPVQPPLPQVVQVAAGAAGQALITPVAVHLVLPPAQMPDRRRRQVLVQLVGVGQQADVRVRVLARERFRRAAPVAQLPGVPALRDQPRQLRPREAGGLPQIGADDAPVGPVQALVGKAAQHGPDMVVGLGPGRRLEVVRLGAAGEGAQVRGGLGALDVEFHNHASMMAKLPPPGSFPIGVRAFAQAHFSLDKDSPYTRSVPSIYN